MGCWVDQWHGYREIARFNLTMCAFSNTVSNSLMTRGFPRNPWNPCCRQRSRVACTTRRRVRLAKVDASSPAQSTHCICVGCQGDDLRLSGLFAGQDFAHGGMPIHHRHLWQHWCARIVSELPGQVGRLANLPADP